MVYRTCLKEVLEVFNMLIDKYNLKYILTKIYRCKTPFRNIYYQPELDKTIYCNSDLTIVYQNLIGTLCWTCEIFRIDTLHKIAIISQYLV